MKALVLAFAGLAIAAPVLNRPDTPVDVDVAPSITPASAHVVVNVMLAYDKCAVENASESPPLLHPRQRQDRPSNAKASRFRLQ